MTVKHVQRVSSALVMPTAMLAGVIIGSVQRLKFAFVMPSALWDVLQIHCTALVLRPPAQHVQTDGLVNTSNLTCDVMKLVFLKFTVQLFLA